MMRIDLDKFFEYQRVHVCTLSVEHLENISSIKYWCPYIADYIVIGKHYKIVIQEGSAHIFNIDYKFFNTTTYCITLDIKDYCKIFKKLSDYRNEQIDNILC